MKNYCAYCEALLNRYNFTTDHIIPKSKGGANKGLNLISCCKMCNVLKSNKDLYEFIMELESYINKGKPIHRKYQITKQAAQIMLRNCNEILLWLMPIQSQFTIPSK